jgi:subtilisin family serine protease
MSQYKILWVLTLLPLSAMAGQYIPSKGKPVENQFIVVFKDGFVSRSNRQAKLEELATANNGGVLRVYDSVLNGGSVKMTEAKARAMANHPHIAWVEQDGVIYSTLAMQQNATWGLDRIDQGALPLDATYSYDFDGAGVHAYIIDTGIRSSHSEFLGRVGSGYDFIDNDSDPEDCNGHGTHVSGTIGSDTYGVAKNVTLHGVRVLDCSGSGSTSGVIAGIDWVTANHITPAVANMSLGGGASSSVDSAINNSVAQGVVHVVAAGNSNADACNYSPARATGAITVGASTSSDARSSFSNWGSCVDVFAPGSGIASTWHSSDTSVNTISGTSMASPHVAGVAALLLDAGVSAADVPGRIKQIATQNMLTGVGTGSPNLLLHAIDDGSQLPVDDAPPPVDDAPPPVDDALPVISNEDPQASFTSQKNNYTVEFTDTSSDNDGQVTSWNWSFGDGTTSTDKYPAQHTYSANGSYTVRLTVTDDDGASSAASNTIRIKVRGGDTSGGSDTGGSCSVGQRKQGKC